MLDLLRAETHPPIKCLNLAAHMDAEEPELAGVELETSAFEQSQYDKIWNSMSQFLGRGGGASSVEGKKTAVESPGKRDMAIHLLLSLGSFDIRLISLIADKRTHGAVQAQEWVDQTHDHGFSEYFYSTRPTPTISYPTTSTVLAYIATSVVNR
jgi:hypothetical protein